MLIQFKTVKLIRIALQNWQKQLYRRQASLSNSIQFKFWSHLVVSVQSDNISEYYWKNSLSFNITDVHRSSLLQPKRSKLPSIPIRYSLVTLENFP